MYFSANALLRSTLHRPLGDISDFVAEKLPFALTEGSDALQAGLAKIAVSLTSDGYHFYGNLPTESARLACVDLALITQACAHAGITPPTPLSLLFSALASRLARLPTMLYEDCVLNNPIENDPRLFSLGDSGACERDFLRLHQRIETGLERTLCGLQTLGRTPDIDITIAECDAAIRDAAGGFAAFHAMPIELFAQFRNYYSAAPGSPYLGVSGRFSERMNTLRLWLDGHRIAWVIPDYFDELTNNQRYFPSEYRPRMMDALADAVVHERCFMDALAARDSRIAALAMRLRKFLDTSAGIHYQLAKKYVA